MKQKYTVTSSNCGLSYVKYRHRLLSVKNEKYQYWPRILLFVSKDAPIKVIIASTEDGLQGIFPSEIDLNGGKVISTI